MKKNLSVFNEHLRLCIPLNVLAGALDRWQDRHATTREVADVLLRS